jgi:hypothetical protein
MELWQLRDGVAWELNLGLLWRINEIKNVDRDWGGLRSLCRAQRTCGACARHKRFPRSAATPMDALVSATLMEETAMQQMSLTTVISRQSSANRVSVRIESCTP